MGGPAVVVVNDGAPARVNVTSGAPIATPVTSGGYPIVLVSDGAPLIALVNDDGTPWSSLGAKDLTTDDGTTGLTNDSGTQLAGD